jgi:uncharacterized protein (DUF2267 family)
MSATGLEVFDKTLQTTNTWLNEIMDVIGPDRHLAWRVLSGVLHTIRDHLPTDLSAHVSAQLPLLVRGAYFDQWRPAATPDRIRSQEAFLAHIHDELAQSRPVGAQDAAVAVMRTLNRRLEPGLVEKIRSSLPEEIRRLWPAPR